jgi:hypothetical protein
MARISSSKVAVMTIEETFDTTERLETWRNSSFSKSVPNLQIAWDSTSFGALTKCPRFYQYAIIQGYTLYGGNDHIKFGALLHAACELYDKQVALDKDHESALLLAIRFAIIESFDNDRGRPWISEIPEKNLNTLLRTLVWYLDKFADDSLTTVILENGKPAVEYSFTFGTGLYSSSPDGLDREEYQLCGHLDKIVEFNSGFWIEDKKSTKYSLDNTFFKQFLPDIQVSIYETAGEIILSKPIDGFLIDGIQVQVNGSRFRRQPIPSSPELKEEFLRDFELTLRQNESYVASNYWPMNRKSCGFGNLQCQFRGVCSSDPSVRQTLLDSMFVKRTWDPLITR